MIWKTLATVWVIGGTVIWSKFFMVSSGVFSPEGNRLFGLGYAWLAVGAGLGVLYHIWKDKE